MGRLFVIDLEGHKFTCKHCQTHLAVFDDFVSKAFCYKHGNTYLFDKVANVTVGEKEERSTPPGIVTMADIFCVGCGSNVGCKYEAFEEESQKFKVGKFALERCQLLSPFGRNCLIKLSANVTTYRRQGTNTRRSNLIDRLTRERLPPVLHT